MHLGAWLARTAAAHPTRPALAIGRHVAADYRSFAARAAAIAGALAARGLAPGDRVAIASRNSPAYLEALYGIWWGGFAAVPVNFRLHAAELAWIVENAGARVCFADEAIATALAPLAPAGLQELVVLGSRAYEAWLAADRAAVADRAPDDLAWLFYTSGTTGRPKGAMLTHRNLVTMTLGQLAEVDPAGEGLPVLHAAPLSHGSGMYIKAHVLRAGVNVVTESGGFDPDETLRLFEAWPGASMFAAPTMIRRLTEAATDIDPAAIRTIIWGGAPMYVEDCIKALGRFGPRFAQIYGQGESPMTITFLSKEDVAAKDHPRWRERLGSAGRPYAMVDVRVADEDGRTLPVGELGEILVRGDTVMAGYWQNETATAATIRDGWLFTGDVGVFDADGYLTLKDRSKDLVISGGSNIYPREIEEVLLVHPAVREVSVIGRPDPDWGEIVVAYVVGEATAGELDRLCLEHIARFKRPKDYVFVEALPKSAYGKILKTEIRRLDAERRGAV